MSLFRSVAAGVALALLALSGAAYGEIRVRSTQTSVTVAVTNTFVQALSRVDGRNGCTIQYVAVAGTKGYVFFGSAAPSDTTTSLQLTNGQTITCRIGGLDGVAVDAIYVTGTATDIFIVNSQ